MRLPELPISEILPQITGHLEAQSNLVLVAPPGAGKTTLVPLALMDQPWCAGRKIMMLEPRRIAARAAARQMASLLGENVGERIGYRVRFDSKVSKHTVVEVVTEGVFGRMLASDPGLDEVAAVIFDEFHERSLDGDLALALCLDLQAGLRDDLKLIAMSATLDGAAVSQLLSANILESKGRSYPVTIVHRERRPDEPLEKVVLRAVLDELAEDNAGDILVFLPGGAEIERAARVLEERMPEKTDLCKLYGALPFAQQGEALLPAKAGRQKVVLASAIAETSLTIEGVTTVIDSGLARQPVFEPATGLTRLQTVRASLASVTQRAGRAGRLGPGRAVRLWRYEQTASLPAQTVPEIQNADLSGLVLDLADWGVFDPRQLRWMDEPPKKALKEATSLLRQLGAVDEAGALTPHGRAMRKLPLPPRLAHMSVIAARHGSSSAHRAVLLALVLQERGAGGPSTDLAQRCDRVQRGKDNRSRTICQNAGRIAARLPVPRDGEVLDYGILLAHAYPDRIAQAGGDGQYGTRRYRLANGRGAELDGTDLLAREPWLVVADMAGRAGAARILSAAALSRSDVLEHFADHIEHHDETSFDPKTGQVSAVRCQRLGALRLSKPQPMELDEHTAQDILLQAVRDHGLSILPWHEDDVSLRQSLMFLHHHLPDAWPDTGDEVLLQRLSEWLSPFLVGCTSFAQLKAGSLGNAMLSLVGHPPLSQLQRLAPTHLRVPSGSKVPLVYADGHVRLSVRPQELFGLTQHPTLLDGKVAVELELLSPAGRPIQLTSNLPGFWKGSWADVRAELRGRYPKHPWPLDPTTAVPTNRAKPRK